MSPKKLPSRAAPIADDGSDDTARNLQDGTINGRAEVSTADAKRLKKRETDRRCQREARQRTKSRIAYLEGLVEELRRQDTSGQVASLMTQLTETRKERDTYARTLRGVEESVRGCWLGGPECDTLADPGLIVGIAQGDGSDNMGSPDEAKPYQRQHQGAVASPFGAEASMMQACTPIHIKSSETPVPESSVEVDLDGANIDASQMPSPTHLKMPHPTALHVAGIPSPSQFTSIHCSRCDPMQVAPPIQTQETNVWAYAHGVIGPGPAMLPCAILDWEDRLADDIPARALAEGWNAAEQSAGGKLPPLWAKLRKIDETVFAELGKVERLAIMLIMHRMMRLHSDGTGANNSSSQHGHKRVPSWYLARPSQQIAHSYAIDFFTWPGIRERFVFRPHEYCTNKFWRVHNRNLRILWPGSFYDCFVRDGCNGSYSILPEFDLRISDIAAWTMTPDFFGSYPEFLADITSFGNIRRTLMPACTHQPHKHAHQHQDRKDAASAAAAAPFERSTKAITQFESDGTIEDLMQWQNMPFIQPPKMFGYKDLDVLPDHEMMWFQDAVAEDCQV